LLLSVNHVNPFSYFLYINRSTPTRHLTVERILPSIHSIWSWSLNPMKISFIFFAVSSIVGSACIPLPVEAEPFDHLFKRSIQPLHTPQRVEGPQTANNSNNFLQPLWVQEASSETSSTSSRSPTPVHHSSENTGNNNNNFLQPPRPQSGSTRSPTPVHHSSENTGNNNNNFLQPPRSQSGPTRGSSPDQYWSDTSSGGSTPAPQALSPPPPRRHQANGSQGPQSQPPRGPESNASGHAAHARGSRSPNPPPSSGPSGPHDTGSRRGQVFDHQAFGRHSHT